MTTHNLDKSGDGEPRFSVDQFRVPVRYFEMIAGKDSLAVTSSTVDHPDGREAHISSLQFVELCIRHFRTSKCETLSTAPIAIPFGSFGLIVSGIAQAGNFEEALRRCVDVMQIMRPDMIATFSKIGRRLCLDVRIKGPAPARTEVGLEFFMMALHSAFRWLTGETLRPVHARAAARSEHHERSLLTVLCCPITRRGTGVTLSYSTSHSKLPIRPVKYETWGAHELPEFARLLGEAADYWGRVETDTRAPIIVRVSRLIREGVQNEQAVALRLGISGASLRRQLADEGFSFRSILSDARRDHVRRLLMTDKSLAAITEEAGYSDGRSLRRACTRWFGRSPERYRETMRQNPERGRAAD